MAIVTVVAAVAIVVIGIRMGAAILAPTAISQVTADGRLNEVHVLGGTVYLGRIVDDNGGALRLADPAVVRQDSTPAPSGAASDGPRLVVDPYSLEARSSSRSNQFVLSAASCRARALKVPTSRRCA